MNDTVIAIDPGTTQSAWVEWNGKAILNAYIMPNEHVLQYLDSIPKVIDVAIEWIESYGMAVGAEVFITCRWCGRFEQACNHNASVYYTPRRKIKMHLCHSAKANDSNVRQALIDRFGDPGSKKTPGVLYGLKRDLWSAFALAVYHLDQKERENENQG